MKQEKAVKLRELKVFSHSTRTVLHAVAETSHGKDRMFFLLILPECGICYSSVEALKDMTDTFQHNTEIYLMMHIFEKRHTEDTRAYCMGNVITPKSENGF